MDKIVKYILIFIGILLFFICWGIYLLANKTADAITTLWHSEAYPIVASIISYGLIWISNHYDD